MATKKAKPETLDAKKPAHEGPCDSDNHCPGMAMALRGGGTRGIGIHVAMQFDWKTGEVTPSLAYRFPKKVDGHSLIVLNLCPWCGVALRQKKTAAPADPQESRKAEGVHGR